MRLYCASPYSSPDPHQVARNILHAEQVGVEVRYLGHVPFVPHIALPPFPCTMSVAEQWEPAMRECLSHLATCDGIVLTGNWQESRGCAVELAFAQENGLRVFYGLGEVEEVAA